MSREQANTYRKFRDADDPQGNLGWSSRMAKKTVRVSPEAPPDVERSFELSEDERVLWRLLKLPRRYIDLESAGVLPPDKVRGVMRGFVSADVVDVVEDEGAKPIIPVELVRLRKEVRGEKTEKPTGTRLKPRVYRPDIGLSGPPAPASSSPSSSPSTSTPPPRAPTLAEPPRTPPPAALSVEHASLKKRIEDAHARMREQNHYQFLGVTPKAGPVELKQAFVKLARELHPDLIVSTPLASDEVLKKKLEALFGRLQEANRVLTHADERKRYEEKLERDPSAGHAQETGKKVRRPDEARVLFKKAEHLLKAREFVQAERHFKMAVELDDQSPEIKAGFAWCVYLHELKPKPERVAEAKRLLAPIADRGLADAAWRLALIAQAEGDETEHHRRISQTLRLNPKHADAAREKRLLEMRKAKEAEANRPKGLFDKLRGR